MFINLLVNAIKFSPENGLIEILFDTTQMENGANGIAVSVKDYGLGIPEGEEEDIFDTFTQSTKTYKGTGGTGLGLSISREIVELHGGHIFARNNGKGIEGSTFTFIIPFQPEQQGEENAA